MAIRPLAPRPTPRARPNPAAQRAAQLRASRLSRARRRLVHAQAGASGGGGGRIAAVLLVLILGTAITVPLFGFGAAGTAAVIAYNRISEELPDPGVLESLAFAEPTIVYDSSGKIELGRFQKESRRVVAFAELPRLVLDATTTAEDRTFWTNEGFDPYAILAAAFENASGISGRGASTITQQLVRARLLPDEVVAPGSDRVQRKIRELIQSYRLSSEFPGQAGKEKVITAYLNEIFYGHGAYGIAAAASIYFGVRDLAKLTPAQAALLAGLPQSPTAYDPYLFAKEDSKGRLVVPKDAPIVVRRNHLLRNLASSRWTRLTEAQLQKALREPVVLAGDQPNTFRAPHFTWQVKKELIRIFGSEEEVTTGGFQVITTLDWNAQKLAEKWVTAAVVLPNIASDSAYEAGLKRLKIGAADRRWIDRLRGKDVHNGALVAIDYRTGDVLAYVGSAGYARDNLRSAKFDPKFDVLSDGYRQPGSAWKPILYATAFDQKRLTPGSVLLDITTEFGTDTQTGEAWAPTDADKLDRGPILARKALQYSLNIPAIRALERVGGDAVADTAGEFGIRFQKGRIQFLQAGLAGALGTVEVLPLDLTSAFGALGNGGRLNPPRLVLKVIGPDGRTVYRAQPPKPDEVVSRQAAFLVSDILAGNSDPAQNPIWADVLELRNGPTGQRRPAAVKTGTTNDTRDLATYGYLAPPEDTKAPAIAVGVWMGNSDHSFPRGKNPPISLQGPAPLWHAFVRELTDGQPIAKFEPPKGVVRADIDAWSGGQRGPWTRDTTSEWFITGTEPGAEAAIDEAGLLYTNSCGFWTVDPLKAELGPETWDRWVADWMARARRGVGVQGELESRTAYFWGRSGWGGPIGTCRSDVRGLSIRPYVSRAVPDAPKEDDATKPDGEQSAPSAGAGPGAAPADDSGASAQPIAPAPEPEPAKGDRKNKKNRKGG